jgi:hypothetical protein
MSDTEITKLRNMFSPIKNYFAMANAIKKGENINKKFLDKELEKVNDILPKILKIISEIPDDAIKEKQIAWNGRIYKKSDYLKGMKNVD